MSSTYNCSHSRVTDPAGLYTYDNLIGATVEIRSLPASYFGTLKITEGTIEDIIFRVTTDGKTVSLIILEEAPDVTLTWKDIEVKSLACGNSLVRNIYYVGDNISLVVSGGDVYDIPNLTDYKLLVKNSSGVLVKTLSNGTGTIKDNIWTVILNSTGMKKGIYTVTFEVTYTDGSGQTITEDTDITKLRLI